MIGSVIIDANFFTGLLSKNPTPDIDMLREIVEKIGSKNVYVDEKFSNPSFKLDYLKAFESYDVFSKTGLRKKNFLLSNATEGKVKSFFQKHISKRFALSIQHCVFEISEITPDNRTDYTLVFAPKKKEVEIPKRGYYQFQDREKVMVEFRRLSTSSGAF